MTIEQADQMVQPGLDNSDGVGASAVEKLNISISYDGSHPSFRMLHAYNWGPMLMNLGWSPFRGPFKFLNFLFAIDLGKTQMALTKMSVRLLDLKPGQHVLDVACGRGKSCYVMSQLSPRVKITGIDLLAENIQIANSVYGNFANLDYQQGDAMNLPFDDQSFDHVHCLEAAFHFPDRGQFIREAYRVLRPGGTLAIVDFVWSKPEYRKLKDDPRMQRVRKTWQFDDFHCLHEYRDDAASAGFEMLSEKDWTHGVTEPIQKTYDCVSWLAKRNWGRQMIQKSNAMLGDLTEEDWKEIGLSGESHNFNAKHTRYMAFVMRK